MYVYGWMTILQSTNTIQRFIANRLKTSEKVDSEKKINPKERRWREKGTQLVSIMSLNINILNIPN